VRYEQIGAVASFHWKGLRSLGFWRGGTTRTKTLATAAEGGLSRLRDGAGEFSFRWASSP